MSALDRGIGSEGLEQGGPNLGNDYTRKDLSVRNAGDALTSPNVQGEGDEDTLNIDKESSRNLSSETDGTDDDVDDVDLEDDDLDDDDLLEEDDDDDDEDDELGKGL